MSGKIGCIIGSVFMAVFFSMFVGGIVAGGMPWPMMLIFALFPLAGFAFFFFRFVLPKYLLGSVECSLTPEQVSPGEQVQGELVIRPRKNVSVSYTHLTLPTKA